MRPVEKFICIAKSLGGGSEGLVAGAKTQSSKYRGGDDVRVTRKWGRGGNEDGARKRRWGGFEGGEDSRACRIRGRGVYEGMEVVRAWRE